MDKSQSTQEENRLVAVREYNIKNTTYVVSAYEKFGALEDVQTKVRRLIIREVQGVAFGAKVRSQKTSNSRSQARLEQTDK